MADIERQNALERAFGRRKEDWLLRDLLYRYKQLLSFGQVTTSEMNLEVLFEVIMIQTNQVMDTQRSTVFLYDDDSHQLWSLVATSMKKNEIRIPADYGVAGWVFQNRSPLIINDAYNEPRFYSEVDKESGFRTRNIICIPLTNRKGQCIGALQALNKNKGVFSDEDRELLTSISHYVAIALENAKLYEDLKSLDRAKERVINHLAHELKTPLAVISAVLGRVSKKMRESNYDGIERAIKRGKRNLNRLMDLQEKIDDILNQRAMAEKDRILNIIEDAASFVEEFRETGDRERAAILEPVFKRLESLYSVEEVRMEDILLDEFLDAVCDKAFSFIGERNVELVRNFEDDIILTMDENILEKVCGGLLKNAIENTPDEGRVEINTHVKDGRIQIEFRDYGVGITAQNKKLIFSGFFHTQDTNFYSSKKPYEFNAGGAGSDLLRTRAFSERYGFLVRFESARCRFIPRDTDLCPGRISSCGFVKDASGCFESGGSTFAIEFPAMTFKTERSSLH